MSFLQNHKPDLLRRSQLRSDFEDLTAEQKNELLREIKEALGKWGLERISILHSAIGFDAFSVNSPDVVAHDLVGRYSPLYLDSTEEPKPSRKESALSQRLLGR
jgi:hypothetical protein